MNGLLAVAESALANRLVSQDAPLTGRSTVMGALSALTGGTLLIGLGFLIYASHLWFSIHYSPDIAAMATGMVCVGLSLLFTIVMAGLVYYRQYRLRMARQEIKDLGLLLLEETGNEVSEVIKEIPIGP